MAGDKNGIRGLVLTYRKNLIFNPAAFEQTRDQFYVEVFRHYSDLHLKALFQSIRRHMATNQTKGWEFELYIISSCYEGHCFGDLSENWRKRIEKKVPAKLHHHCLLVGTPVAEIYRWINEYWYKRHGQVRYKTYGQKDISEWMVDYFSSQDILTRKLQS